MRYNIGDFVKGTGYHLNSLRMDDIGVILSPVSDEVCPDGFGYWVAWFNDKSTHFAEECELELVKVGDLF